MTLHINFLSIAIPALQIAGFLLLLRGFMGLKKITASDTGRKTIAGEIDPDLIKLGIVLIIISLSLRFVPSLWF